ncbi:MAG: energy-coupling factor transporter transmembrane protein EcfT [Clostridia bacterium]|nr:energy-coupling factor transporter transmembrane protein EcfT [Clostridia bacterium]
MKGIELAAVRDKNVLQLDPRTKVLCLLLMSYVMLTGSLEGKQLYLRILLALIPFVLIMTKRKYSLALGYLCFYLFVLFGDAFVLHRMNGIINLMFVFISAIAGRFLPGIMLGYYVMTTTTVSEFIAGMERMHISQKLIIPVSVMFRYFPTIAEESNAINSAMKMRGIEFGGTNRSITAMLEYRLVPVMMSTVKIGDELSAASLTKGLGGEVKRTNLCKIGFHVQDILILLIVITCFTFHFIW